MVKGPIRRHLLEGERVTYTGHRHAVSLVGPFLLVVAEIAGIVALLQFLEREGLAPPRAGTGALVLAGLAVLVFSRRVLRWRMHRYIVTTRRVVEVTGVLVRNLRSIPLASVTGVDLRRSMFGALLGYGRVTVSWTGSTLRLQRVTRPAAFHRAIIDRLDALRHAAPARRPVEQPAPAPTRPYTVAEPVPAPSPQQPRARWQTLEGTVLDGRYAIDRRLARGGMGVVYEGTDDRLGRRVAIKVLREELALEDRFIERFRSEARAAAALAHHNIASIFDYGEEGRLAYIVMELVRGHDLYELLEAEGTLAPQRSARIVHQVLDALEHAHENGVVHRDVKPANVIIDRRDVVKVTDFGIAQAVGAAKLTATGVLLGSAHYVSPEQVSGADVTPASDVFSAGVLLYELLVGAPPFEGDSLLEVARRRLSEDVPPPSERAPGIARQLDAVVLRATERDPAHRYSSAQEMADALERCLDRPDRRHPAPDERATRRLMPVEEIDTPPARRS